MSKITLLQGSIDTAHTARNQVDDMVFHIKTAQQNHSWSDCTMRMKVPNPKPFNGTKRVKELDMGYGTIYFKELTASVKFRQIP